MHEHEIRWYALLPVAVLLCFAELFAEIGGLWPAIPFRPLWLWSLAFHASLRTPPTQALAAFFVCGLIRDLLLGPRLGAGTMAFVVMGWMVLHWRFLAVSRGLPAQAVIAGWSAFLAAAVKHLLDYGPQAYKLVFRAFFLSMGDGLSTGLLHLPLVAILTLASFRPWRERDGYL